MAGMRGDDRHPDSMFNYVSPEQRGSSFALNREARGGTLSFWIAAAEPDAPSSPPPKPPSPALPKPPGDRPSPNPLKLLRLPRSLGDLRLPGPPPAPYAAPCRLPGVCPALPATLRTPPGPCELLAINGGN